MLNTLKRIQKYITSIGSKHIHYFNGEMHVLSQCGNNVTLEKADENKSANIMVLALGQYQESTIKLPVVKRSEALKLLKLQLKENQVGLLRGATEDHFIANIWQFDSQFLKMAKVIIPESLLLARAFADKELVTINTAIPQFFVSADKSTYSATQSPIVNSSERFMFACGINALKEKELTEQQKLNLLLPNLLMLSPNVWQACAKGFDRNFFEILFYKVTAPALVVISLYAVIVSGVLYGKSQWLKNTLANEQSEIGTLFDLQNNIDTNQSKIAEMSSLFNGKVNHGRFFHAVAPIFEFTRLSNMNFQQGRYLIRGEADSATQILELLSAQQGISDVKFDRPVTKSRRRERFVISLVLLDSGDEYAQ